MNKRTKKVRIALALLHLLMGFAMNFTAAGATVTSTCPTCVVGYPYASTNPLTSIAFNESTVLKGFNSNVVDLADTIRAYYSDEHALALGIRQVIVKSVSGSVTNTVTNNYPITPLLANPSSVTNPLVGSTNLIGDQAGTDLSGRPMFPALFITDTTVNATNKSGDWQWGGTAIPPHAIFGTWKAGVRTVDKTKSPPVVTVTLDADPAQNSWNLGNGDPVPYPWKDEGYTAEARWNVADLRLLPGHAYRLYFMVHDGDQNNSGGDTGQGCVTICVPCLPLTATPLTNVVACPGQTTFFSTTVFGATGPYAYPYSFQWYRGTTPLPGQTNTSLTLPNVSAADAGTYRLVVTGSCGNPFTNSATLSIIPPPVIACASNKTVEIIVPWTFDPPTGNYPITIVSTVTNFEGHCGNTFDATRTWQTMDTCGHTVQCSQTVNVVDTTRPVINCQPNRIVQLGSAWDFDMPTVIDTGGTNNTITVVSTITNRVNHCGDTFDATRTWLATDACSNSTPCSQTVTLVDTNPPVITCPTNIVLECPDQADTNKTGVATATDAESQITITYTDSGTNTCGSARVILRTWKATDSCSNSATCVQMITVRDTTVPTIVCPQDMVLECPADTRTNRTGVATAQDTCGSVTIKYSDVVSNSCGGTNLILRTWVATDACGNTNACVQRITVQDTTPPALTLPRDLVLECPANTSTNATGVATAQDRCGAVTIRYADVTNNSCGGTFVISRTWTATDACGNSTNGVQTITVQDAAAPTLTRPADIVLECPLEASTNRTGVATAVDTCSSFTIGFADSVSNSCGGTKTVLRTWTVTDACGNSNSAVQTITIRDITPPSITCPSNVVLECPADTSTNNTGVATATDTCGSVSISYSDVTNNICGGTFVISRTWTATDACGNTSKCVQTITVRDTAAPVITCPQDVVLECPADTSTNNTGVATARDTCSSFTISFTDSVTNNCGGTKIIARTWRAIDACSNSSSCVQMITVQDKTKPTLTCPPDVTLECPADTRTNNTGVATAQDKCGSVNISYSDVTNNNCGGTKVISRTWNATDACGNNTNCVQTITVRDTTPPTISCPTNVVLECPADTRTNMTGVATAQDTCSSLIISYSDSTNNNCGGTKVISRTWIATDACGNSTNCVQTITVRDTTPPTITCPSNIVLECPADTSTNRTGVATAQDTCGSVRISYSDSVSNNCGGTSVTLRTWTATDDCGNTARCVQIITLRDTTPPALSLPGNLVLSCPADTRTNVTGMATATDRCGSVTISYSDTVTNGCGPTRTISRVWTATDQCGNSTNRVQTIAVIDTNKPSITCQNFSVQCAADIPSAYANLAAFLAAGGTASDSCSAVLVFSLTSDSGLVGKCPGKVTRVYRVTDECGNFAECTQTITVSDTIPPVLTCASNVIVECGGSIDPANTGGVTATDNCSTNVSITHTDATLQSQYDIKFYVADPDTNTGPYALTYLEFSPAGLPCPDAAILGGRALDPLRNAVAFAPNGQLDALTSIGNVPMGFGQIVPFEVVIQASGGPGPEHGTIEFTANWSAYTTSNNRFGYDTNYKVYCAFVDAADPGSIDPNNNARVESYHAEIINPGTIDEAIQGTFRISGLDDGDRVVVEIWVVLDPEMPDHTGGTIASTLVSAQTVAVPPATINVGTQTDSLGNLSKIFPLPPPQQQPPLGPLPPQPPALPGATVNVIDRTWTATDDCGNSSTCVQRITVRDTTRPSITVPPNLVLECPVTDLSTNALGFATAQDCSSVRVYYSDIVSNGCGGSKVISRTWTATDSAGNSTNVVQTITIRDTSAPSITCPPNKVLECPADTSTNNTGVATAQDGCSSVKITYSDRTLNNCGGTMVISRTWTATDDCGNISRCVQTITVRDTTPPVISCPSDIVLECPANTATNNTGVATAQDTCGSVSISYSDSVSNTCGNAKVISRTWTATDACGNSAKCVQTITVRDSTPPSITCPPSVVLECPANTSTNATGIATASDACGSVIISYSDAVTNSCGGTKLISRTWTAVDQCGNSTNCVQTIMVHDSTPPSITCPQDFVLECPANTSTNATGVATAQDGCGGVSIRYSDFTNNTCGGTKVISRTWIATDQCGNSANCVQTITVRDTTPPSITCPQDVVLECPANTSTNNTGVATAQDGCGSVSIRFSDSVSNNCAGTKVISRTWTATDQCGNSANCVQKITVRDTIAPTITCPQDVVLECPANTSTNNTGVATAQDGCGSVSISFSDSVATNCGGTKVISRTWRATDQCGNSAVCVQTITVRDTTPPSITCPANVVLECPADTTTNNTGVATAQDGCGSVTISFSDSATNTCGNAKVILRTWTATDQCGNNANCVQIITVRDTRPPTVTCPANVVLECPANTSTNNTGVATAQDGCGSVTVSYSDAFTNSCGGGKVISRTWTATDQCGNSASCVQTITVRDTTPPTITCPTNVVLECPGNTSTNNTGVATAQDSCSFVSISYSDSVSNNCGGTKIISRTWTATDACGNNASCVQTITVKDTTRPTITCPQNVVLECPADTSTNNTGVATAQDLCSSVTISYSDQVSDTCGGTKVISRTWTATDQCGNNMKCIQTITVRDTTPPVITCPADIALECPANPNTNITGVASAQDTCSSVSISFSDSISNTCGGTRIISRTWTATDACGNSADCIQTIRIRDTTPPTISCPANEILECPATAGTNITGVATAQDGCGTVGVSYSDSVSNICGNAKVISRTWTATDQCGNRASCVQTITIRDTTAPTITCPPDLTLGCGANTEPGATGTATAQDTCGSASVTYSDVVANLCGSSKQITRTWTATDACGNTATCVQTITVRDTTPPTIAHTQYIICTYSQGGFGGGGAPGQVLQANYTTTFPNGITLGVYVPSNGTAAPNGLIWEGNSAGLAALQVAVGVNGGGNLITQDAVNPTGTFGADGLGRQTLALILNVGFNTSGALGNAPNNFGSYVYTNSNDSLNGFTMNQIIGVANRALAGLGLPAGYDANSLSSLINNINIAFEGCTPTSWATSHLLVGTFVITVQCTSQIPAPDPRDVTAADSCSSPVTITNLPDVIASNTCANNYTIIRTWVATDACGNTSSLPTYVVVNNPNPPILTVPSDRTLQCPADISTNSTGLATAQDGCGVLRVGYVDTVSNICGGAKVISRKWTVSGCASVSGTQTITVRDTTPPTITAPPSLVLECPADTSTNGTGVAVGQDGCGAVAVAYNDVVSPGCGVSKTITRTWTATDGCGNSSTAVQTITLRDTTAPTLTAPPSVTLECPADSSTNSTGVAQAQDNCGSVSLSYSDRTLETCGNTRTISRTWVATDPCGNSANALQTITIRDTKPPTLTCNPNKTIQPGAAWDFDVPSASDTCSSATVQVLNTITNQPSADTLVAIRTWVAKDACGNSNSCQQTVTVFLATMPTIVLQPIGQGAGYGSDVTLSAWATNTGPTFYQWMRNGTNIAGATNSTLLLKSVTFADAGLYCVICSNAAGSVTSSTIVLNVVPKLFSQFATNTLTLTWPGPFVLQSAASANGPYLDVAGATSPYQYNVMGTGQMFFRLRSQPFNLTGSTTAGQFLLNCPGVLGCNFVIQGSTDLVNWTNLQTNSSPSTFIDSNSSQYSSRFYRAILAH